MLSLYAITLFLSAGLLFLVQPLFAKTVLPLLGGAPAVWSTCMVFFQGTLVLGYAYAHLSTRFLAVRRQALLHAVLVLGPLMVLPPGVPEGWRSPTQGDPVGWLLGLMTVTVGPPLLVVASTAPLLQKWFAATAHPAARDPYHLYVASNCGSVLALLAYPLVVEPTLRLFEQRWLWSGGYALLVAFVWGCALALRRSAIRDVKPVPRGDGRNGTAEGAVREVSWGRRLRWIALTAVPSSLMLGVTTYLTTDIAVVPLLWVIPLALYLLTFILAFARRALLPHRGVLRLLPIATVAIMLVLLIKATEPIWLVVCVHLVAFFVAAMACHGELARDRPDTSHLTEYYLLMSLGGMLGGVFTALVAPVLFASIAEYPLALVAACLLMPTSRIHRGADSLSPSISAISSARASSRFHRVTYHWPFVGDLAYPALLGVATVAIVLRANRTALPDDQLRLIFTAGLPALACFLLSRRPVRFGLAVGAVLFAGHFDTVTRGTVIEAQRTFFGVHRVTHESPTGSKGERAAAVNELFHGTTLHGMQFLDDRGNPARADHPLVYYHRDGPAGQLFRALRVNRGSPLRVGMVGLGAGSLLGYGTRGDRFQVYEIDPAVVRIATDARFFTFIASARQRNVQVDVTLGDARLTLARAEDGTFDLLVLDAFGSDAVPVHLLTREAVAMYVSKLDRHGKLAFHISNRYLRLESLMAALADDLGLVCALQYDTASDPESQREKHYPSRWAVMARTREDLQVLDLDQPTSKWRWAVPTAHTNVWTDDFSNILGLFDWGFAARGGGGPPGATAAR